MVVSDLSDWMAMFAIDLTSVAVEDTVNRSKIVSEYKQSILECGVRPFIPAIEIDFEEGAIDGVWQEPNNAIDIDVDKEQELNNWSEPNDALVIDIEGEELSNNNWSQPFNAIVIDGCEPAPHGVWVEPNS